MNLSERLGNYAKLISSRASLSQRSGRISEALARVPRHMLVGHFYLVSQDMASQRPRLVEYMGGADADGDALDVIYSDRVLATRLGDDCFPTSSTSQPSLVASMLQLLDLDRGMRVLEIGAGTGYNAALMAELVGDPHLVTTIDIQPDVVDQTRRLLSDCGYSEITVVCGDGLSGIPDTAGFDRVIVTVGCPDVSWRWVEQLVSDGVIVVPLQHGGPGVTPITRLLGNGQDELVGRVVASSGFMPLQDHSNDIWPASVTRPQREPDTTYELPVALAEAPRTIESFLADKRAWWDFAYFLALDDPRSHFGHVLALVDADGNRLFADNDRVVGYGSTDALYDDLVASYERWEELGRPRISDWRIRMFPNDQPRPIPAAAEWLVSRPTTWQLTTISDHPPKR